MGAAPSHSVKTVAKSIKRAKAFHPALAPDHALRRIGALHCAIHKANVTVALLFQPGTLIELKRKWAALLRVRGRPIELIGVPYGGGVRGVRRFIETNSVGSN